MGEISLLDVGVWPMAMPAVRDTRAIEVPRVEVLTLISQIFESIIITVLAARKAPQAGKLSLRAVPRHFEARRGPPGTAMAASSPTRSSCTL